MNVVVQIYMIVCVVLLVFDVAFLMVKNARNQRFYPKKPKFRRKILEEIEHRELSGEFSKGFPEMVQKKIARTKYLLALQAILEEKTYAADWFREIIYAVLPDYRKKSEDEQAYYAYVISTLGYEGVQLPPEFAGEFMTFLESKSLYTFANTMAAVYAFGDMNLLMHAIELADEREGFYHTKLLVDGLLSARVEQKELAERLMESYERYRDYTREGILTYFRFSGADAAEFCRKVLQSETGDREIRYAALRYFVKYPDEKSVKMFIRMLTSGEELNWVEEMLAIEGLAHDPGEDVRRLMKEKVTSVNWYVRMKAAEYLKNHGVDPKELEEIVGFGDRYANEALLYQYREDPGMSACIRKLMNQDLICSEEPSPEPNLNGTMCKKEGEQ